MRKKRVVQAGKCYHLVSRVAHRAFFFDDDEKDRFVDLLMRVEFFSCVRFDEGAGARANAYED